MPLLNLWRLYNLLTSASSRYEELANMPFDAGYPTEEGIQQLKDELLFQRATQVYLWALPAIKMYGMKEGSEKDFSYFIRNWLFIFPENSYQ